MLAGSIVIFDKPSPSFARFLLSSAALVLSSIVTSAPPNFSIQSLDSNSTSMAFCFASIKASSKSNNFSPAFILWLSTCASFCKAGITCDIVVSPRSLRTSSRACMSPARIAFISVSPMSAPLRASNILSFTSGPMSSGI